MKVTIYLDAHEAHDVAAQIVARFGPFPVPSVDVPDISVEGRDA